MCEIAPFRALRPNPEYADRVASPPYDVLNREEALQIAGDNPFSFLHVTRAEIDLPAAVHVYSQVVYEKAGENIRSMVRNGVLLREEKPCYYFYRLTMEGRSQTGLVCVSSVDDYEQGRIRKHEFTRPEKELDRINHMAAIGAQTGNVFLAYHPVDEMSQLTETYTASHAPAYDFKTGDGVGHAVWVVDDASTVDRITEIFRDRVPNTYIADGHHRAASAAKVRGSEKWGIEGAADFFLTTLFPGNELRILDYNRVVKDLNGHSPEGFLEALAADFEIEPSAEPVKPAEPHTFGAYLEGRWHRLRARPGVWRDDPIGVLDVTILSERVLDRLLGIHDQRTDKRVDFVGGIRGLQELQRRVDSGEMAVAFSLHPVSIGQLFDIADSGQVMPPKSTWFEPKLRDGLLTHVIRESEEV